ncbi:hypothetical protein MOQ_001682 [Trypanosoma cruzi marinkellei]|uniref:Costars domain-containing protein n=1 Tax=Trypanosoma cruzi marinkellei TaxID=85056 RepID=K2NK84_TRYCR|nr:hypothetical protein MOQ_001682 [Trypanosoma cruzi marinkellei]
MVELIIDTNADIDLLLRELQRLNESLKKINAGRGAVLLWGEIYSDSTLQDLFQERLASVMSAAKKQRAIHFPRERLLIGKYEEVEVELLAPHLRILPESAIRSKSKQEERTAAFKEAKLRALEAHKEKMLGLAMQGMELPSGKSGRPHTAADGAAEGEEENGINAPPAPLIAGDGGDVRAGTEGEKSDDNLLPPPPPPADDDDDDDETESVENEGDDDEEDPPPPPPPPEDDDDDDGEESDEDDEDDDDPPPPPPPE